MILLLKHLTDLSNELDYEIFPSELNISAVADLARIKHYRNFLAHLETSEIENTVFSKVWDEISSVSNLI